MIRYYYLKWKLLWLTMRVEKLNQKRELANAKLSALQTLIAAGFASEKQFAEFNRKLIENRKRELDPTQQKQLEQFRQKHYGDWKPKRRFKDSKDRFIQQEAQKREQERTQYVRVLKNRPLKPNPNDLVKPGEAISTPLGEEKGQQNG